MINVTTIMEYRKLNTEKMAFVSKLVELPMYIVQEDMRNALTEHLENRELYAIASALENLAKKAEEDHMEGIITETEKLELISRVETFSSENDIIHSSNYVTDFDSFIDLILAVNPLRVYPKNDLYIEPTKVIRSRLEMTEGHKDLTTEDKEKLRNAITAFWKVFLKNSQYLISGVSIRANNEDVNQLVKFYYKQATMDKKTGRGRAKFQGNNSIMVELCTMALTKLQNKYFEKEEVSES